MNIENVGSIINSIGSYADSKNIDSLAYSLRAGNCSSNHYYADIAAFADQWIASLHPKLDEHINLVQSYRILKGLEKRNFYEMSLDLLALGVYLHEHTAQVEAMPEWIMQTLNFLIIQQNKYPDFDTLFKFLRGLFNGIYFKETGELSTQSYSITLLKKLVRWLYLQNAEIQAQRFSEWLDFFNQADSQTTHNLLSICQELVLKFSIESEKYLGRYALQVENYRNGIKHRARWRYDAMLITSTKLEYYLGMLGTEILNRSYRSGFETSPSKLVILPPCICAQPEKLCRAVQTPLGAQCTGCTPSCRVNQITTTLTKKRIKVVMVPDDELSKLCISSGQAGSGLGVVGVACVLRNWTAGWEARRLGLHAQGVPLDYPGCSKHWHKEGVSSDLNAKQIYDSLEKNR